MNPFQQSATPFLICMSLCLICQLSHSLTCFSFLFVFCSFVNRFICFLFHSICSQVQDGASSLSDRHQFGADWGRGGARLHPQTPVLPDCGLPHQEQPQHGGKSPNLYFGLNDSYQILKSKYFKCAFLILFFRCCTFRPLCWCFCWESSWGRCFLDS